MLLGQTEIRARIALREPALHLDRVLTLGQQEIVAEKAVSVAEGCYPVPGGAYDYPMALMVESLAQACVLLCSTHVEDPPHVPLLGGISGVQRHAATLPGDVIRHHARILTRLGDSFVLSGESHVADRKVLDARRVTLRLFAQDKAPLPAITEEPRRNG